MFSYEDIMAQLQAGTDSQDIANEFAAALNKAVAEQKAADKQNELQKRKVEKVRALIADAFDFIQDCYPDMYDAELAAEAADPAVSEELVAEIDKAYKEASLFKDMMFSRKKEPLREGRFSEKDVLAEFLKRNGL